MGRPERALDPTASPSAAFACQLRQLRVDAGNPSYRTLARRTNYSMTALAEAARGDRLPTLAVTLAFVTACGGDVRDWERRWHDAHDAQTNPRPSRVSAEGDRSEDEPVTGQTQGNPARRWNSLALVLAGAVAGAALTLLLAAPYLANRPAATPAKAPATVDDGADPRTAGCGDDANVLDTAAVTLTSDVRINGRLLPRGTVVGTLQLRHSNRCAGGWAKFVPVPGLNPKPEQATVGILTITTARPIDQTQASWRMGHLDTTYTDLLLTGHGCVQATATVEIVGQNTTATGQTQCLPKMS